MKAFRMIPLLTLVALPLWAEETDPHFEKPAVQNEQNVRNERNIVRPDTTVRASQSEMRYESGSPQPGISAPYEVSREESERIMRGQADTPETSTREDLQSPNSDSRENFRGTPRWNPDANFEERDRRSQPSDLNNEKRGTDATTQDATRQTDRAPIGGAPEAGTSQRGTDATTQDATRQTDRAPNTSRQPIRDGFNADTEAKGEYESNSPRPQDE